MSLENINNQNEESENIQKVSQTFGTEEGTKEIYPANMNHFDEVVEYKDIYFPESIKESYTEKIKSLHAEFSKINNYLLSKKMGPVIAKETLYLLDMKPVPGVLLEEKMQDLKKYEKVIASFEKNGVPEEVFRDAKKKASELNTMMTEFAKMQNIAENHPEQN